MTNETPAVSPGSAGGLLRAARQAQGLHIAALAAALKVTPAKLEALEADRLGELPDATFARALAKAVCRQLRIAPEPVLALMPPARTGGLAHVHEGINAPYRERAGQEPVVGRLRGSPLGWASVVVVAAAAVVMFLPSSFWRGLLPSKPEAAPQVNAPAAAPVQSSPAPLVATPVELPAVNEVASAAAGTVPLPAGAASTSLRLDLPPTAAGPMSITGTLPSALPGTGEAVLRANESTWVEVVDVHGKTLLARTVKAGEMMSLKGDRPLKVKIGNAVGAELLDQGQAVDIKAATRDNIARLELK